MYAVRRAIYYLESRSAEIWPVDYLLKSQDTFHDRRPGAAITVLVLYSTFLLLIAFTHLRLLYVVTFNSGCVPRGPQWYTQQEAKTKGRKQPARHKRQNDYHTGAAKVNAVPEGEDQKIGTIAGHAYGDDGSVSMPTTTKPAPGLQDFFKRDLFICQGDGRPIWCHTCLNWKPDRTHHCREIDRCVRKMDHFCPWWAFPATNRDSF